MPSLGEVPNKRIIPKFDSDFFFFICAHHTNILLQLITPTSDTLAPPVSPRTTTATPFTPRLLVETDRVVDLACRLVIADSDAALAAEALGPEAFNRWCRA